MPPTGIRAVATNRRAYRDFEILDTVEAGMKLQGSEVKSLRDGKCQIADAFARIDQGEAFLHGVHIPPYKNSIPANGHDPDRHRKLLLNRAEIDKLAMRMQQEQLTLVPTAIYFKDGRAKCEIGLAKGRSKVDKRQVIAKRDADREAAKAMAAHRRRGRR